MGSQITLRELFNHSSGIADYCSLPAYPTLCSPRGRAMTKRWTQQWLVELGAAAPATFPPGTSWALHQRRTVTGLQDALRPDRLASVQMRCACEFVAHLRTNPSRVHSLGFWSDWPCLASTRQWTSTDSGVPATRRRSHAPRAFSSMF